MKFRFTAQPYQLDAVAALTGVFSGQTKGWRTETVGRRTEGAGSFWEHEAVSEIFSNKKLELGEETILRTLQSIQKESGLPVSKKLEGALKVADGSATRFVPNLTVEMETGTGKTYVYTRMMHEMYKEYGWNKFIVMVPSVAIREGVYKSLQITEDHFQEAYGKKIRFFIYDTKNKSNLVNIKRFGQSADIEVIVMNYQAFGTKSKDSRKIYQRLDEANSEMPIEIIRRARPILVIDEPQRFGKTAEGMLAEFNPLFITRFSATHKEDYNKIYRLDAIDAYNHKLVKKIKVKGIEVRGNTGTNGYLFLDRIHVSAKEYPSATVQMEFETKQGAGIRKVEKRVREGDNLYELSGGLAQYEGFVVRSIDASKNCVSFLNGIDIFVGQVIGDVDEAHIRRIQIRETIASHVEKERALFARGIKVLSLFFIDEVAKYRAYDEGGNKVIAEYERIFEEEYAQAIAQGELFDAEYRAYLDRHPVTEVHNGYFSVDKKGRAIDSKESRGQEGSDDASAYDLIMKDKERLLSFAEPTRFIFSHSALREGWDNPNIFQICTLRHTQSTISKRQEIGRGLRIAVDDDGTRMDAGVLEGEFFDVNTLTVVANEAYDSFARELQKEILDSLSDRPAKLESAVFRDVVLRNADGASYTMTDRDIRHLLTMFEEVGYIDEEEHVTEKFIEDREERVVKLPENLVPFSEAITDIVSKVHAVHTYRPAGDDRAGNVNESDVRPNENFAKREFQELWNRIKVKTVYEVSFESEELIRNSINAIDAKLEVRNVTARVVTGEQAESLEADRLRDGDGFVRTASQVSRTESILGSVRYDLVGEIARGADITRQSVGRILSGISPAKFTLFSVNPEDFIAGVTRIITGEKAATLIDKITYTKTDQSYEDDVFTINRLQGTIGDDVFILKKHIYDYLKADSNVEAKFAQDLALDDNKALVFAKLPRGFKIPTPVGNYSPDWAIVFDEREVKHVYFIAETKGSMQTLQLKGVEKEKIEYAKKHFAYLSELEGADIAYDVVDGYESLLEKVMR
jgi:type III restriction enzyme